MKSMLSAATAVMYLADQRGSTQVESFRSFYTFNFGSYQQANKSAFGRLNTLNDETIKASTDISYSIDENTIVIIIPLVGNVKLKHQRHSGVIEVGQMWMKSMYSGDLLQLINPYQHEPINFLQIRLSNTTGESFDRLTSIELDSHQNTLITVHDSNENVRISIGKFDGRKDTSLSLLNPVKGSFVFVIDGAFEVENRLLQSRDGMAIWNTQQLELESLSNEAIILVIDAF